MSEFDWRGLRTAHGDAGSVPESVAAAEAADDPLEALDLVEGAATFVCDGGTLNEGAPALATALLRIVERREGRGEDGKRPIWPFLRGVLRLVGARAAIGEHFGLAPAARPFAGAQVRSPGDVLIYQRRQMELTRAVDRTIAAHASVLARSLRAGGSNDRATAIVLAVVAGVREPSLVPGALEGLEAEQTDLTRASLLLGLTRLAETAADVERTDAWIAAELMAGGLRAAGAAIAGLWRWEHLPEQRERVLAGVKAALGYADARPAPDRFDYGWHEEMPSGEAARAVWGSALEPGAKLALLKAAVQTGPRVPHDGLGLPATNAAAAAAWFLMRLGLGRHLDRTTIVGPEDLSDAERDVLRFLREHDTWMREGGTLVQQFGLPGFHETWPRLLLDAPDVLSTRQAGAWQLRAVFWSRWKWLRAAIDHTPVGSEARAAAAAIAARTILEACDLDAAIAVTFAAAAEPALPFEALLVGVIERIRDGEACGRAALTRPIGDRADGAGADQANPAPEATRLAQRVRCVRLLLAAALGTPPPPGELVAALKGANVAPQLREVARPWTDPRNGPT